MHFSFNFNWHFLYTENLWSRENITILFFNWNLGNVISNFPRDPQMYFSIVEKSISSVVTFCIYLLRWLLHRGAFVRKKACENCLAWVQHLPSMLTVSFYSLSKRSGGPIFASIGESIPRVGGSHHYSK